jgi:hypothetical protein
MPVDCVTMCRAKPIAIVSIILQTLLVMCVCVCVCVVVSLFVSLVSRFCVLSGVAHGLVEKNAPKDFSCRQPSNVCRGLDSALTLYAIAHVLWKPLFGVGGYITPPGVVSDFYRPRIESIVAAAAAAEPDDRPPPADLRRALLALVSSKVQPFFVPHNSDGFTRVIDFVFRKDCCR